MMVAALSMFTERGVFTQQSVVDVPDVSGHPVPTHAPPSVDSAYSLGRETSVCPYTALTKGLSSPLFGPQLSCADSVQ
jgi:hypothetical protein